MQLLSKGVSLAPRGNVAANTQHRRGGGTWLCSLKVRQTRSEVSHKSGLQLLELEDVHKLQRSYAICKTAVNEGLVGDHAWHPTIQGEQLQIAHGCCNTCPVLAAGADQGVVCCHVGNITSIAERAKQLLSLLMQPSLNERTDCQAYPCHCRTETEARHEAEETLSEVWPTTLAKSSQQRVARLHVQCPSAHAREAMYVEQRLQQVRGQNSLLCAVASLNPQLQLLSLRRQ
mmetsp:Transcript_50010/g.118985  ORF Transcript_50010/g.118985 Transcript_50010/m.118985 type:complete len:231 (+) Transcript_50010:177-869(+)